MVIAASALLMGNLSEVKTQERGIQDRSVYYFHNYYKNHPNASKPIRYTPASIYNQIKYIGGWLVGNSGTHYNLIVGRYGWVNRSKVYTFKFDSIWYPLTNNVNYQKKINIRLLA